MFIFRWNFVINGCIDGYSRLVIYLKVHTNNLAKTMVADFVQGIKAFAVPSRVRADKGGEFVHICSAMNLLNGESHNSFITGKSVHNIRIERLWRDVFCKVANKFYHIFSIMESNNILDIENHTHLAALHHVFGQRIQNALTIWKNAHNNHPLRTEGHKTPMQLWYKVSQMEHCQNTAVKNLYTITA